MKSIAQFFSWMNHTGFPYVVMRNWDNLPHSVELGEHSDLDLLVYDLRHWMELFPDAKHVHAFPRVQFKVPVADSFILVDVRHVGDGYYPRDFQMNMINLRTWNKNGFFTPNPDYFRMGLAYHAVHHKNNNKYERYLGPTSIEELYDALKKSSVGWVKPDDPTVGSFHSYFLGSTSIVVSEGNKIVKRQINYHDFDLIENEARILKKLDSIHFPKFYSFDQKEGTITLESCGEKLTPNNIPPNWEEQLDAILKDLAKNRVIHRDIRPDNLMVKDGVIKLIDFGWAMNNERDDIADTSCPDCLGMDYKPSWGFDDFWSMRKIKKEIDYKMEKMKAEDLCIF